MKKLVKIKKALISLSDKSNLKDILINLKKYRVKLISSGGTYKEIVKLGYKCEEISNYTNFKEMLDGRVKTLHPKIHAGILSIRNNKKHNKELKKNNFEEIDLVIVNFYPFEKIIKKTKNYNKIIENIDIGGPTLARAAAKNFKNVVILSSTNIYQKFFDEIKKYKGATSLTFRENLAVKTFNEVAFYDSVISNYLSNKINLKFPEKKTFHGILNQNLRYGENPHQEGSFYSNLEEKNIIQLHGKKLSFNNYNDIFSALEISGSFTNNTTVIIKHANPCGVSTDTNSVNSFKKALNSDPVSAFGGVVCCNFKIDKKLAYELNNIFFEIIIAKGFKKNVLKILKTKKNVRLIDTSKYINELNHSLIFHKNTFLLQDLDQNNIDKKQLRIVSNKKPSNKQWKDLIFAFKVCKNAKSNAIVLVKNQTTIGIGSGQPNRLDSCKIAVNKAKQFQNNNLIGSIAASDAFFPFVDGFEKLIQSGINAVIQPSGSIRDKEIIKFANKTDTVLVFSNTRHFKH